MTTKTVLGTCHHDCPDSCGWIATVEDGVAVKLRGNPDHPFSQGELCPKVNHFLDRVYSPERLLHPLVRTGPKGEGKFERATWEQALSVVAERLHETTKLSDQPAIRIRLLRPIPLRAPRLTERSACPAFRDLLTPQATADLLHCPTTTLGVYKFGRAASRRI